MGDQPEFIAAEIKDDSVVAHEIDGTTELPLYLCRIGPRRLGCRGEPSTNGPLGRWVTRPEFFQRTTRDQEQALDREMPYPPPSEQRPGRMGPGGPDGRPTAGNDGQVPD